MTGRRLWVLWWSLAGLLGLTHWAIIALAVHLDATTSALYGDPLGLTLAIASIGIRLLWWGGGPALVAMGCADIALAYVLPTDRRSTDSPVLTERDGPRQ